MSGGSLGGCAFRHPIGGRRPRPSEGALRRRESVRRAAGSTVVPRPRAAAAPAEQRPADARGRPGCRPRRGSPCSGTPTTSRGDAGRRSGSSTRSMTSRKAISSGGKRMTLSATTSTSSMTRTPASGPVTRAVPSALTHRPDVSVPAYARAAVPRRAGPRPGVRPPRPPPPSHARRPHRRVARSTRTRRRSSRTRRARRMARELAADPPRRPLRARLHERLRAAGRHGAVGADHRQDGQQGDADAVRPLPRRGRPRRRRPRGARDDPQAHRLLPGEGELGAGAQPGAGRAVRRRGAAAGWPTW